MDRVDTLEWSHRGEGHRGGDNPAERAGDGASPFFWWVRALLAAGGAVALFPVVFAVVVKAIDLGV